VVGSNPAPPAGWEDELNRFLEGRIARYKLPRRWQAAQTLPRTALGKVQKAQLARLFEP
jgi:fatty-acyl-CoA synthase